MSQAFNDGDFVMMPEFRKLAMALKL